MINSVLIDPDRLGALHFWVGIGGLCGFVLTGQYMDRVLDHLVGMSDGPRMLYRSAHIYILLASLMNLLYGVNFRAIGSNGLQAVASFLIALSPALMLLEFYCGATSVDQPRWYVIIALYPLVGVVILFTLHQLRALRRSGASKNR